MERPPSDKVLLVRVAAVLQARFQVAFLVLAAASLAIFLVRRRQLRPWR
jgi:hypothetical protein